MYLVWGASDRERTTDLYGSLSGFGLIPKVLYCTLFHVEKRNTLLVLRCCKGYTKSMSCNLNKALVLLMSCRWREESEQ